MAKLRIEQGGETEEFQEQVFTADKAGERLDVFCARVSDNTRSAVQRMINSGDVTLNGAPAKSKDKLRTGDAVTMALRPPEEVDIVPQDIPIDIIYEDADIAVIDKPKGMVVHPAPGNPDGTLVNALMYHLEGLSGIGGEIRPGIVHRLDATTSGLMVVARNGLAQEGLFKDFKERRVRKEYLALCWGEPPHAEGSVKYPIGRDPYSRLKMACVEDGREAWTDYKKLWSCGGKSLVICRLHSGRTHQIRVHMQAMRCPLVGDRLYAPSRPSPFGPERLFLHAWRLGFTHPRTREEMNFVQPLPPELTEYVRELRAGSNSI